jgi:hypothetical protein
MPAVSANKPGIGGRVYRNTGGTWATPTWGHVDKVLSVTNAAQPWDMVEAGSRATRAKVYMEARCDVQISFTIKADDADAGYKAVRSASLSPTGHIDFLVLDGLLATEGVEGWRGEFKPVLTNSAQDADGSIYDTFDLKAKPTANAAGPSTVVVGSGSTLTMTPL